MKSDTTSPKGITRTKVDATPTKDDTTLTKIDTTPAKVDDVQPEVILEKKDTVEEGATGNSPDWADVSEEENEHDKKALMEVHEVLEVERTEYDNGDIVEKVTLIEEHVEIKTFRT